MRFDPIEIDIGSLDPYETNYFDGGSGKITCATPFWSPPVQDKAFRSRFTGVQHEIWIDLNILSSAGDEEIRPNIVELINWSKEKGIAIGLTMAIYEKYRTNSKDPIDHIVRSAVSLRDKYGVDIDENEIRKKSRAIASRAAHHSDFDNHKNSIVVFRSIFSSNLSFKEKCEKYADIMCKHLIPTTSMFLIAALLFYLDEFPEDFPPLQKKLRKDLKTRGDYKSDLKSAYNIASDIGLFTYASWPRFDFEETVFPVISVATSDTILALILEQLCHCNLYIANGINLQTPAYRIGSIAEKRLSSTVLPLMKKFRECDESQQAQRQANSSRMADLILAGKYTP